MLKHSIIGRAFQKYIPPIHLKEFGIEKKTNAIATRHVLNHKNTHWSLENVDKDLKTPVVID